MTHALLKRVRDCQEIVGQLCPCVWKQNVHPQLCIFPFHCLNKYEAVHSQNMVKPSKVRNQAFLAAYCHSIFTDISFQAHKQLHVYTISNTITYSRHQPSF